MNKYLKYPVFLVLGLHLISCSAFLVVNKYTPGESSKWEHPIQHDSKFIFGFGSDGDEFYKYKCLNNDIYTKPVRKSNFMLFGGPIVPFIPIWASSKTVNLKFIIIHKSKSSYKPSGLNITTNNSNINIELDQLESDTVSLNDDLSLDSSMVYEINHFKISSRSALPDTLKLKIFSEILKCPGTEFSFPLKPYIGYLPLFPPAPFDASSDLYELEKIKLKSREESN